MKTGFFSLLMLAFLSVNAQDDSTIKANVGIIPCQADTSLKNIWPDYQSIDCDRSEDGGIMYLEADMNKLDLDPNTVEIEVNEEYMADLVHTYFKLQHKIEESTLDVVEILERDNEKAYLFHHNHPNIGGGYLSAEIFILK